jgi:hypothetical protein
VRDPLQARGCCCIEPESSRENRRGASGHEEARVNSIKNPSEPLPALRRRDFLTWGSLAALAPWTPWIDRAAAAAPNALGAPGTLASAAGAAPSMQTSQTTPAMQLSAGYLEGSEQLANLRRLPPDLRVLTVNRRGNTFQAGRSMVPADQMPGGDPALVGGAVRLTVHDLYPSLLPSDPATALAWPQAVDLDVLAPLSGGAPGATARYLAWSYRRLPAEDRSARVSLLLWPDWYSDLSVILRVVPGGAGATPRTFTATFSLGAEPNRPKLLKGVYLLGLREGTWNERADLPDDPSQLSPDRLSVLMTIEPEGVHGGQGR